MFFASILSGREIHLAFNRNLLGRFHILRWRTAPPPFSLPILEVSMSYNRRRTEITTLLASSSLFFAAYRRDPLSLGVRAICFSRVHGDQDTPPFLFVTSTRRVTDVI